MASSARRLTYLLLITIIVLSLWPHAYPTGSGMSDKLGHFLAYAAIAFTSSFGWPRRAGRAAAGLAIMGLAIETVQPFIGRSGDVADWMADLIGLAAGMTGAVLWSATWSTIAARWTRDG